MVRHRSLLPALALAAGLGTLAGTTLTPGIGLPGAAAAPAADEVDAPLAVTIGNLTPSALSPRRNTTAAVRRDDADGADAAARRAARAAAREAPVRVSGTVTNRDDETWTEVNLFPFVSTTPLTSTAEIEDAAATDPEAPVGDRLVADGPYATIDELAPGETAAYSLEIPREDLPARGEGVYWFGVHALGSSPSLPSDGLADGRARTFLPLVDQPRQRRGTAGPNAAKPVQAALVLPLRRAVRYEPDGSIAGVDGWVRALSAQGPLRSLLDLGRSADGGQVTWLIDPAVVDAAARLAAGNPGRSLAATLDAEAGEDPDAEEPATTPSAAEPTVPAPPGETTEDPAAVEEELTTDEQAARTAARAWLADLRPALASGTVLALPYGDLDVVSAATLDPKVYEQARAYPGAVLEAWGVDARPAVAPAGGYLDEAALAMVDPGTTVVVSDQMVTGSTDPVASVGGRRVVVAASGAAAGGPGPDDRTSPVAVRQRLLAEAAVRRLSSRDPLVVVLPATWSPSTSRGFFPGLDVSWLSLGSLGAATSVAAQEVPADRVSYPDSEREAELGPADLAAARSLTNRGRTLQNVLRRNDQVAAEVAAEALTGLSVHSRPRPASARARAEASREWIDEQLASVEVAAPARVTLSSASGRFSVTLTNRLDQPVTVALRSTSAEPIDIEVPETVDLGPRSRRSVLLVARADQQGIHNVTLTVTDLHGTSLGTSAELPVRSAQVSSVIWVITGVGVALLLGAGTLRLVRRVRRARALAAADPAADHAADHAADPDAAQNGGSTAPRGAGPRPTQTPEDTPA